MANEMKVGLVLSATDRLSRVVDQAVSKSTAKFKKFEKAVEGINSASNKMFVAGGVIAAGIWKTIEAAEDGRSSSAKLESAFSAMWGDSGMVKKAVRQQQALANAMALQIGVDDDIIQQTQAKLTTFKKISSETAVMSGMFERATRAAFDLSAMGFGDALSNATQLGKALNDPMNGASAMKKAGTLEKADLAILKQIQLTKGLAAAQEYLLKAVEKQVKGTAEKSAKATDIMKTGFGQVTEAIGGAFLPTVDGAKVGVTDLVKPTLDWIEKNQSVIRTVAKLAIGLLALAAIMRVATFLFKVGKIAMIAYQFAAAMTGKQMLLFKLQYYSLVAAQKLSVMWTALTTSSVWAFTAALLANPITWVVIGIMALIAVLVLCWKKFAGFRAVIKTTWEVVKGFGNILKDYVIDRIKGIIEGLGSMGKAISLLFKGKFAEATAEAGKGIKALSGYDAKMKAFNNSKKLVGTVSQTYTGILKKEQEAQKGSESVTAMKSVAKTNNVATNSNSSMTYAPVINVASGSPQDKQAIMNILKDNKRDFAKMFLEMSNNNKRTSFTPAF